MSITFGAEAEFQSTEADFISAVALGADKFVVAYRGYSGGYYGAARVGTVSGTDITFGPEAKFLSAGAAYYVSAAALSTGKFVVAYTDNTDSNHGTAKVGTVTGTDVTFGAETEFKSSSTNYISAAALSATAFVVAYNDGDFAYGAAKVGTVSGTGITFGTEAAFQSNFTGANYISAAALSATAFVVAYRDVSDPLYGHGVAKVGSISGTSIAFGAATEFLSANGANSISAAVLSSTAFVVAYADATDGAHGTAKVGTVSGTTITFGAETEFLSAGSSSNNAVTALNSTQFIAAYRDGADGSHGTAKVGTVSGTDITFSADAEFLSADGASHISAAALGAVKFVAAYQDAADSFHGTAKVGSLPAAWATGTSDSVSTADSRALAAGKAASDSAALTDGIAVVHSHAVAVASDPSGVPVSASTDEDAAGDGTTPFSRRYADGAGVTLAAPAKSGNRVFLEWRDGGGNTLSSARSLGVTVTAAGTYTAHYEFAGDSADDYLVASP